MQLIVHVYGKAILVNSDDPNFAKKFQLKQRITKILSFEVLTMSVNEISIVLVNKAKVLPQSHESCLTFS